jgi:hypothetical protein
MIHGTSKELTVVVPLSGAPRRLLYARQNEIRRRAPRKAAACSIRRFWPEVTADDQSPASCYFSHFWISKVYVRPMARKYEKSSFLVLSIAIGTMAANGMTTSR